MNRVLCIAFICVALFALAHRPASAMVEYCPATLSYEHVNSSTFGLILNALGPRTLTSTTLAFDTSAGWYIANLPATTLVEKDRHYRGPAMNYIRHDWVTPVIYVWFPAKLTILHAWVYETAVQGDPMFGWDEKGQILCAPPPAPSPEQLKHDEKPHHPIMYGLDPNDDDRLSDPPSSTSLILHATSSTPLERADCSEPFREAEVSSQARPEIPGLLAAEGWTGVASSNIAVAVQPDGSLRDEWIWGPSGLALFDGSAMKAAKMSQYTGARAYCQPVPSVYLFRVTFSMP